MTIRLDLLDTDGTFLRTLTGAIEGTRNWSHPRRGFGRGYLAVPIDHDDYQHLTGRRFVQCWLDGTPRFTWIIQDPTEDRISPDGHGGRIAQKTGAGALAYLGTGDFGGAVVVTDDDTDVLTFGWMAREWDTTGWTSPAPYSGGHWGAPRNAAYADLPDRWLDPAAEWLFSEDVDDPTAEMWGRHTLDAHPARDVVMYVSGVAEFFFNGESVASVERRTDMHRVNLTLTGDDVLAWHATGKAIYTIGYEDADGTFNVLYRSTTGAPYDNAQPEIQSIVVDAEAEPYPWGPDYPSTGPDQLQGKIYFKDDAGNTSAGVSVIEASGTFDPALIEADLEAFLGVGVSCTGTGVTGDPLLVTWDDNGPQQLLQLDHHDLRHDHDTTAVTRVQEGGSSPVAIGGEDAIVVTLSEPAGVTYGYVMSRLIDAAIARGAIPAVTYTFTDPFDSQGQSWTVSLPVYRVRDGELLGDVTRAAGQSFKADYQMLPDLELGLYDHLGTDRSATVQATDEEDSNDPAVVAVARATINSQVVRGTALRLATAGGRGWVTDTAKITEHGRIELPVSVGTASSVDEVDAVADGVLDDLLDTVRQTIETPGPSGARPYTDYFVGDDIGIREAAGGSFVASRTEAIGVVDLPGGEVDFDVDVERRL